VVFALLLLLNRPQLDYRVSGLVWQQDSFFKRHKFTQTLELRSCSSALIKNWKKMKHKCDLKHAEIKDPHNSFFS